MYIYIWREEFMYVCRDYMNTVLAFFIQLLDIFLSLWIWAYCLLCNGYSIIVWLYYNQLPLLYMYILFLIFHYYRQYWVCVPIHILCLLVEVFSVVEILRIELMNHQRICMRLFMKGKFCHLEFLSQGKCAFIFYFFIFFKFTSTSRIFEYHLSLWN